MKRFLLMIPALLMGCGTSPQLQGTVVDLWGDPVEGAMVKMEGSVHRPLTDANGRFSLPWIAGSHTIKAGREGYIQEDQSVTVSDTPGSMNVTFNLFKIPEEKGFHVIGSDGYVHLAPKLVRAYGNNLKSLYGLKDVGDASVDGSELRIVYHGDLRIGQLMALDISLHSLAFTERAELVGVTARDVPLNLYTADERVSLKITRLKSRNDYLLQTTEPLEQQRVYALTTNELLTPLDDESFQKIAPPLRLAFPVELR